MAGYVLLKSSITRANSKAFLRDLKKTNFTLKRIIHSLLLENFNIFCLETTDLEGTRVLLAQVLINLKEDEILNGNLNEINFSDFTSFTTIFLEQIDYFMKNFPDLFVCVMDNQEELLVAQCQKLKLKMEILRKSNKKIIFIVKNAAPLEKILSDYDLGHMLEWKLNKLWKENEISNTRGIFAVPLEIVDNEPTSSRALVECTNNKKEEASSEETIKKTSDDKATAENTDFINLLQSFGMKQIDSVDEDGNTLLHLTACDGNIELVQSLLLHGVKKDMKNDDGATALHLATEKGHSAIVQILLEHGFDVNATDNFLYQNTPLHNACLNHNDTCLVEILLKFGAEIERKDDGGRTALHVASWNGHSAVVTSLLKNSADVNAVDNWGDTPLHRATSNNKQEVVSMLLEHGAILSIKNNVQQNALDLARHSNREEIIKILENFK